MKTKNLFFATALVASFASCTNDDIVEVQQGIANVERPTVENVKLNFVGEGADSRVVYNGEYAWQSTDKIGALLMSNPRSVKLDDVEDKWYQAYELVNYISTSYPFAYDTEAKVWGNDAKMLEGDYFFAHPWSAYEGERYLKHSLKNQTQTGVSGKVVAKDFADNQFFVGYSQIKKGTAAVDALTDVAMTPVLGGIQFRIINNGSKTYHINKIEVKGEGISTTLTLDPTSGDGFNYASYTSNTASDMYEKLEDRAAYLRSFVVAEDGTTDIARLSVKGTKSERAIAKGKTGYAVVMLNEFTAVEGDLTATIYTDEGVIEDIDLTEEIDEYSNGVYTLVDNAVTEVSFEKCPTVSIKFKDEAITTLHEAEIYDNEDLYHLIEWNALSDIEVEPVATIVGEEVELTKEMFDLLKSNEEVTLTIQNTNEGEDEEGTEALTLAADLPANVLDYKNLVIKTPVVVANAIELTEDSQVIESMAIAEEGSVTIEEMEAVIPEVIVNEGNILVGSEGIVYFTSLTNEGVVTIAKDADVKASAFTNNGTINNNGYLEKVINAEDAVITLGKDAILKGLTNEAYAEVETAEGALVEGTNAGLINFVTGAVLDVENIGEGMVAAEAPTTVTKDMYDETGINTLKLQAGKTTTIADSETGGILYILTAEGATLKVADDEVLTLNKLFVDAKTTIKGEVEVDEMTVAKNVKLYNNGVITVNEAWSNKGIVYNNGKVYLPYGSKEGTFKYTSPVEGPKPEDTSRHDQLKKVIIEAIDKQGHEATLISVQAYITTINAQYKNSTAANVAEGVKFVNQETVITLTQTEFDAALAAVKADNVAALKTALLATTGNWTSLNLHKGANTNATLYLASGTVGSTEYKTAKTVAYNDFRETVLTVVTLPATVLKSVKLAASALSNDDVDAILAAKAPNAFIWEGCNLDLAVAVWKKHDGARLTGNAEHDYTASMEKAVPNTNTRFVVWVNAAIKDQVIATELSNAGVSASTLAHFSRYTTEQFKACAGL